MISLPGTLNLEKRLRYRDLLLFFEHGRLLVSPDVINLLELLSGLILRRKSITQRLQEIQRLRLPPEGTQWLTTELRRRVTYTVERFLFSLYLLSCVLHSTILNMSVFHTIPQTT